MMVPHERPIAFSPSAPLGGFVFATPRGFASRYPVPWYFSTMRSLFSLRRLGRGRKSAGSPESGRETRIGLQTESLER